MSLRYYRVADIGNTLTKVAIYCESDLVDIYTGANPNDAAFRTFLNNFPADAWIISSVVDNASGFEDVIKNQKPGLKLNHQTPLPINIRYSTPETLGNDRIANMVGAQAAFPGEAVLVIDAGTCIKYDILLPDASYPGGTIAPGIQMRLSAMHNFTSQLPLIQLNPLDAEKDFPVIGDSTKGSLISGSIMAAIMEAEGIIAYYREQFGNLKVMLTGGDASYFATRLKNEIFAVPNLTLNGLQTILHYNINSI